MRIRTWIGVAVIFGLGFVNAVRAQLPSSAQSSPSALAGTVERIKLHGKSLEGNLEGDSPDRDVAIYLPPSYTKNRDRRYPVVYFLHGWTQSTDKWYGQTQFWAKLPAILNKTWEQMANREMIFVTPDAFTRYRTQLLSFRRVVG